MRFSKILNREKSSGRVTRKTEVEPQEKIIEERFIHKSDVPGIPRYVPRDRDPEAAQRNPDVGNPRLAENRIEERPWSSNLSDSTHHNASTRTDDMPNLPALQITNESEVHARGLAPLSEDVIDPDSFDLAPAPRPGWERPELFSLERRSLLMFSKTHMRIVFHDLKLLRKFSAFLVEHRPESVPLLVYHLDARKALAAIKYTNAVSDRLKLLGSLDFTKEPTPRTVNDILRKKAEASFEVLANEDLPAWITSVWMKAVEVSIRRRINGSLPSQLRDMSEGLAETFVLADPARYDNPILFASEEFNRMTQYSNKYIIGRNCRIFQGPKSDPHGIRRIREKLANAEQHYEPLLNYRRDGSPFMNLLMITPLLDSQGKVRYYLGAQIDTSGLLNDFYGFEHLHQYLDRDGYSVSGSDQEESCFDSQDDRTDKDELRELSELFNHQELDTIRKHGGRLHHPDLQEPSATWKKRRRLVIAPEANFGDDDEKLNQLANDGAARPWNDEEELTEGTRRLRTQGSKDSSSSNNTNKHARRPGSSATRGDSGHDRIMSPGSDPSFLSAPHPSASASFDAQQGGHLGGVYDHYLLVRPAPHLRILFASPSLRVPGMVQSSLMERVGGPPSLRQQIEQALHQGQGVTAKVRWLDSPRRAAQEDGQGQQRQQQQQQQASGRSRWIHATPLLGRNGEVGVWMVVLVDEERDGGTSSARHGGARSVAGASVRSAANEAGPAPQPPSMGSRNGSGSGSVIFHGTDAGSVLEPEAERHSSSHGLRPPPRPSSSSQGKTAAALYR